MINQFFIFSFLNINFTVAILAQANTIHSKNSIALYYMKTNKKSYPNTNEHIKHSDYNINKQLINALNLEKSTNIFQNTNKDINKNIENNIKHIKTNNNYQTIRSIINTCNIKYSESNMNKQLINALNLEKAKNI